MGFKENGYIGNEQKDKLMDIADSDQLFNEAEFKQLAQEVKNIYKNLSKDILTKSESVRTREDNALLQASSNLETFDVAQEVNQENIKVMMMYLQTLYGGSMTIEEKNFYMNAFDDLAGSSDTFREVISDSKDDIAKLDTDVRSSIRNEDVQQYAGSQDARAKKKTRRQGERLERQETKGKDKKLMRTLIKEYIGDQAWSKERSFFKSITKELSEINAPQAVVHMRQAVTAGQSSQSLIQSLESNGYIWLDESDKTQEAQRISDIYIQLIEEGGVDLFGVVDTDADSSRKQGLAYLLQSLATDVSLADAIQATKLTQTIDQSTTDEQANTVVTSMISDLNHDGSVVNAPDANADEYINDYKAREKSREGVDAGILGGSSLSQMIREAEGMISMEPTMTLELARTQVVKNIIQSLAQYTGDQTIDSGDYTYEGLLALYQQLPYMLANTQRMLQELGSNARLLIQYGQGDQENGLPSYTDMVEFEASQKVVDLGADEIKSYLSPEQIAMMDAHIDREYDELMTTLRQQMSADPSLNTPELNAYVTLLEQNKPEYVNKFKINGFGIVASAIKGNEGIGAGTSTNVRLNKNYDSILQRITVGGGIFVDKSGSPAVGVSVAAGGAKEFGSDGQHQFFYSGGLGLGYSKHGLTAGPYIAPGVQFQTNLRKIKKSLDTKAAQHIGVVTNLGLGTAGASMYRSRDKLKGIKQTRENIESTFGQIFQGVTSIDDTTTESIHSALQETYPKTDDKTLLGTATTISRILAPYTDRRPSMDAGVKVAILKEISDTYALNWYNMQVQNIGGLHLSQLGTGLQFVDGCTLPTVSAAVTLYKSAVYSEQGESLAEAQKDLEQGRGIRKVADRLQKKQADAINTIVGLKEKSNYYEKFYVEGGVVNVPTQEMSTLGLNLHIQPELKQFVRYDDEQGTISFSQNMITTFRPTYRNGEREYDLIIGSVGLEGTEQVVPGDLGEEGTTSLEGFVGDPKGYDKLLNQETSITTTIDFAKIFDSQDPLITKLREDFGNPQITSETLGGKTAYMLKLGVNNLQIWEDELPANIDITKGSDGLVSFQTSKSLTGTTSLTYTIEGTSSREASEAILVTSQLPTLSSSVRNYVDDPSYNHELRALRNGSQRSQWLAYRSSIQAGSFGNAMSILQEWHSNGMLSLDPSGINIDDLRAVDTAMSVVQLTKFKNLSESTEKQREDTAIDLWNQIKENTTKYIGRDNKEKEITLTEDTLKGIVDGTISYDDYHEQFYFMMSGEALEGEASFFKDINSPIYKLFWLVAPNKHVLTSRDSIIEKKFEQEGLSSSLDTFKSLRRDAVSSIEDANTYSTSIKSGAYAMVLGYPATGQVEEKFVPNPELVSGALISINDRSLRQYYLENLPIGSPMIQGIIDQAGTREAAINAILDGGLGDRTINAQFSLGYYGKCFNETIILEDLTLSGTRDENTHGTAGETYTMQLTQQEISEQTDIPTGVYIGTSAIENEANRRPVTHGIGVVAGDISREEERTTVDEIDGESATTATATADQVRNDLSSNSELITLENGEQVQGYRSQTNSDYFYYRDNNTGEWLFQTPGTPPTTVTNQVTISVLENPTVRNQAVGGVGVQQNLYISKESD